MCCGEIVGKRIYPIKHNYFGSSTLESAYWAGFIAADGCLYENSNCLYIQLGIKDEGHLVLFGATIGKTKLDYRKDGKEVAIQIYSKQIKSDLINIYNILPRKSLTHQPPKIDGDVALAYIIGYIDGDGCITYDRERLRIDCLGTETFLKWVTEVLGIPANIRQKNSSRIHQISYGLHKSITLVNKLQHISVPRLRRKWDRCERFL